MTQTRPDPRVEGDTAGPQPTATEPPTILLRNEDDTDHALDVCIAAGDGVLVDDSPTVDGDSQRTVTATASSAGTVRVELRADHGGSASLAFDPGQPGPTPVPEFVIRRETIVVAGLR
ncbi:hypothetical protein [Halococcus saccharolyticus]|uniref:Uncharacterized protein n=1 Tax=Halococcus saccharolyticus DSM 5350 TaxID=1227455 RepID=M0MHZ9_9EURY|nr:hypothetical protein [Halococcus saccharolyticus]EMA44030.1 hypothetical protein C449_10908 [Halococcus saccharolyticus DSM 5350]